MKGVFNTLTGLFDRVGLMTNVSNTVGMLCRPCCAVRTHLDAAYEQLMMGEGITYRYLQRLWVKCPECGTDLAAGSLVAHHQKQHVVELGDQWETPPN